jgi:hypothetical protein
MACKNNKKGVKKKEKADCNREVLGAARYGSKYRYSLY